MKFNSLESFRGIAALVVAAFHSSFIDGSRNLLIAHGEVFVDFFFVLSGFVMAFAYQEKIVQGLDFKKFILLRFGRLYPLHLFTLLVWVPYILAKGYVYHSMELGGSDPFSNNNLATFISNLLLLNALNVHDTLSWNYPAWSISVEFYTYIIFYIFAISVGKYYRPVFALSVSVIAYGALFMLSDKTLLLAYDLGILRCVGGFFLGVYVLSWTRRCNYSFNAVLASLAEILVIALMLALMLNIYASKWYQLATFMVFALVVYLFSIQSKGIVSIVLNKKPLIFLGTVSYSIYMTHALVHAVIGNVWQYVLHVPDGVIVYGGEVLYDTRFADLINVLSLLLIVGVSYLTYVFIEKPWRARFRNMAHQRDLEASSVKDG